MSSFSSPFDEAARVVGGDDEVGLVARDRLDVRLEAGQVAHRRFGRVVGLVVDGDHLLSGADGEERLRGGGREGDDGLGLLLERERAVVGFDRDGERRAAVVSTAADEVAGDDGESSSSTARRQSEREQDSQEGCKGTVEHVSSFREGNGSRRASGLLTRGSPLRRLPGPAGQWHLGGGASPLTAAGPCRTRTGFP